MSKKRELQIDVKGSLPDNENVMECTLFIDGRFCTFYMSKANYESLIYDGVFIRNGKEKDSAGCINTTHVYVEK